MKCVFSSDHDDQSDLSVPDNTNKVIGIIAMPKTHLDILICKKISNSNIVELADTSLLTRQETDGSGYYTSLTGEVVEVDPSQ